MNSNIVYIKENVKAMLKIYFKYILIISIILFSSACAFYLLAIPKTPSPVINIYYATNEKSTVELMNIESSGKEERGHSSKKVIEECLKRKGDTPLKK